MLAVLTAVGVANYLDRYIPSITLPLIRAEFNVSDAMLGLLVGPVFAVVYALMGIPLGTLADRAGRRRVIAGALAFFSASTALCGLAGSFGQLLAARFATGAGEAGVTPAANAMLAELYPCGQRTGALSIYAASSNIGFVLAFFGGGWIAGHAGWRAAFLASAAFGLIVLMALGLWVREPPAIRSPDVAGANPAPGLGATLHMLWARATFRYVAGGAAIASVGGYAAAGFVPSFLARSHHMTPASIGLVLALLSGTVGWAGTALTGVLTDRWGRGDLGVGLVLSSAGLVCALPFHAVFYLAEDLRVTLLAAIVPMLFSAVFIGPSLAAVQHVAAASTRACAVALFLLILNLVGLGVGPQLVGIVSDLLRPRFGEDALRYALLVVVMTPPLPAAWCLWRAGILLRRTSVTIAGA